jgi:hypothetical protein
VRDQFTTETAKLNELCGRAARNEES